MKKPANSEALARLEKAKLEAATPMGKKNIQRVIDFLKKKKKRGA